MRGITVNMPYAGILSDGIATVLLETFSTDYRGPVAIVSAHERASVGYSCVWADVDGPRGCALAVADLIDVRKATSLDGAQACRSVPEGAYAWVFRNIRPLPLPLKVQPIVGKVYTLGHSIEKILLASGLSV